MSIVQLNQDILDPLYFTLEQEIDQKALGCCSHWFRQLHEINYKYVLAAKYISENYTIHATNVCGLPLAQTLKRVQVILSGETHSVWHHRKIFAGLVHLIFDPTSWVLLTEGEQKPGTSQIRYIKDEIARAHQSWDIKQDESEKIGPLARMVVRITSLFIALRDETDRERKVLSIEKMIQLFIENGLQQPEIQFELFIIRTLLPIHKISYQFYEKNLAIALYKLVKQLIQIVTFTTKDINIIIDKTLFIRDCHLVFVTEKQIKKKRVLLAAGKRHVSERDRSPVAMFRKKGILFMSLIPKEKTKATQEGATQSPRERLKEYSKLKESDIDWTKVCKHYILNPKEVLIAEIEACVMELKRWMSDDEIKSL